VGTVCTQASVSLDGFTAGPDRTEADRPRFRTDQACVDHRHEPGGAHPYTIEQGETGWFCAQAPLPGNGSNGERQTRDLENWQVLGGRYRSPLSRFPEIVETVTQLELLRTYESA
jgi:hypothetical protein